jgi:hypothetical protein
MRIGSTGNWMRPHISRDDCKLQKVKTFYGICVIKPNDTCTQAALHLILFRAKLSLWAYMKHLWHLANKLGRVRIWACYHCVHLWWKKGSRGIESAWKIITLSAAGLGVHSLTSIKKLRHSFNLRDSMSVSYRPSKKHERSQTELCGAFAEEKRKWILSSTLWILKKDFSNVGETHASQINCIPFAPFLRGSDSGREQRRETCCFNTRNGKWATIVHTFSRLDSSADM